MVQNANKVGVMNLANNEGNIFDAKDFVKLHNLHLILDGCDLNGNFRSITKEF